MLDMELENTGFTLRQVARLEERLAQLEWDWDDLLAFFRDVASTVK